MLEKFVEVRRTLHRQRRGQPRRIVGVAAHGDVDRDDRLAGRLEQAVVKAAAGLGSGGPVEIAVEAFGDGVLDDLGLGCRAEIRVEDLELEAVFGRRRLQAGEAREAIGVVDAFGEVGDAVLGLAGTSPDLS